MYGDILLFSLGRDSWYLAYIMDTNEEERAKVRPPDWSLTFSRLSFRLGGSLLSFDPHA